MQRIEDFILACADVSIPLILVFPIIYCAIVTDFKLKTRRSGRHLLSTLIISLIFSAIPVFLFGHKFFDYINIFIFVSIISAAVVYISTRRIISNEINEPRTEWHNSSDIKRFKTKEEYEAWKSQKLSQGRESQQKVIQDIQFIEKPEQINSSSPLVIKTIKDDIQEKSTKQITQQNKTEKLNKIYDKLGCIGTLNKNQSNILWAVDVLLSLISVGYGIYMFDDREIGQGVLFTFVLPIILNGGLFFYRAKEK